MFLSAQQLPSLTPQECQSLSPGESVLLPLLCSTIHALNSIGLRVDKLYTRMHDLGSQVANSLIGPEIWDLRNSVSDLSRHVAPTVLRPTPSSSVPTPPSKPTSGRPNRPSAPPPAVPRDTPPHPAGPPPPVHMPMSSMEAPASSIRLLLQMLLPPGAKAKKRSLLPLPLPPRSCPSWRPPHPRVLLPSPVPQGDSTPPGTYLPPIPNATLSVSVGPTWPPPS